ncbi:MAG TPA: hypothetical protein VFA12_05580 [Stellaceae bacterium]|nr:hypothetical protein [Stellaceae bacterium]
MTRTKWMRLIVRDLSDVVRWASRQNARQIDDFRYRIVNGHESVSFRMVPAYPIQVGARDIVVICHVRLGARRYLAERAARLLRRVGSRFGAAVAPPAAPVIAASAARNAEIHPLPWVRNTSPSAS